MLAVRKAKRSAVASASAPSWNCLTLSLPSGMISRRMCNRQSMSMKRARLARPPGWGFIGFVVLPGGCRPCKLPIKGFSDSSELRSSAGLLACYLGARVGEQSMCFSHSQRNPCVTALTAVRRRAGTRPCAVRLSDYRSFRGRKSSARRRRGGRSRGALVSAGPPDLLSPLPPEKPSLRRTGQRAEPSRPPGGLQGLGGS